jgi:hypothetical protein
MHNRYVPMFCTTSAVQKILAMCLALYLGLMPAFSKDKVDFVPPGNWGAVESLEKGTSISLRMASGDKMDGKLLDLDDVAIQLMVDKKERSYPRSGVVEVWRLGVPDRKINGILIGMAGGVAAALIATAGISSGGGSKWDQEDAPGPYFVLAGLGFGALIGGTTDALIKGNKLLYRK